MKKFLMFLFLVFNILCYSEEGGMGLSPEKVEFKMNKNSLTKEISVINNSAEPMRIEARVLPLPEYAKDRYTDLSKQIVKISPSKMVVPPGKVRTIRFTLKDLKEMKPGKYGAMIGILQKEKNPQTLKIDSETQGNVGMQVIIEKEVAVAIIGIKE